MSQVARTAATVVGAVALVATGVGAAAAVGIGTGALFGVSAGTVAAIGAAATIGSAALAAVASRAPGGTVSGSQTAFSASPDDALPLMIGRTHPAGCIRFRRCTA